MDTKRLTRKIETRQIGGVAAGLAAYTNLDVTLIRLAFALLMLVNGFGAIVYMVMWLLIPAENATEAAGEDVLRDNIEDISSTARDLVQSLTGRNSNVLGLLLLGLGLLFLLNQLIPALSFGMVFAISLVTIGLIMLIGQLRGR